MSKHFTLVFSFLILFTACNGGFERFAPPANSISGRGAKVNPRILSTTPSNGSTVSPVTGAAGSQIRVVFDMTMATTLTPVINTYVRDLLNNEVSWFTVANSGATFTWSSTTFLNDTLTIQLGWVRWPENNFIGFDFNNDTLKNLDDMPLANDTRYSFYASWETGRYKVVHTGQYACYYYSTGQSKWIERESCIEDGGEAKIGTLDYPAGQNGFIDPMSNVHGPTIYGAASGGLVNGRRFVTGAHPQNLISSNCPTVGGAANCQPFSVDSVTSLVWKTCSEGQTYWDVGDKCYNAGTDFTWGNAVNACAAMNTANGGQGYGGRRDWRLPTIQELESLVDYGARSTFNLAQSEPHAAAPEGPAIHGYAQSSAPFLWEGPFPNTPVSKGYWTATGVSAIASGQTYYGDAYVVEFKKGSMGAGGGTGALLESNRRTPNRKKVRCVAGPDVLPVAQSLTAAVVATGATMTNTAAVFAGFDSGASFNVTSASGNYDIQTSAYSVTVNYNKTPDATVAGITGNYCIAAASATTCAASSPLINTAIASGNGVTLGLASALTSNAAYKVFVSNITTASDQWQTGRSYSSGSFVIEAGNVYRALTSHTSTASFATDLGNGDWVLVPQFAAATPYANSSYIYDAAQTRVVQVISAGYTSGATAQDGINNGFLNVTKTMITSAPQALSLARGIFTGPKRTASPPVNPAFHVTSAASPNLTSVQVTFDRLPNATEAATIGNYCIISSTANPWSCATPLATISAATLSGYTVTLTTSALTAGTAYAVLASGITTLGSHVVNDSVNKLRWQRCRRGTFDNPTCPDDGVLTNDNDYWNNQLNYCDGLNAQNYDGYQITGVNDPYRWRAPTVNELKSIANRSLFGTVGVSIDTTIFPTPNVLAEDFASSTNYSLNGPNTGASTPNYNIAWSFNYIAGFPSLAQKDYSTLLPLLKPPKKSIRCVRSVP